MNELDIDKELVKAALARDLFGGSAARVQRGRFEFIRRIGQGAMGVVYEVLDTERDHRMALKVLSRLEPNAIYRLKREFRSLSDVVHPNLVTLGELFHEQAHWFFSMELITGQPFDAWVRSPDVDRDERLALALPQLCSAVEAIHAAGKLHRDLKPSNVLVADGRVVVLDFGLVFEETLNNEAVPTESEILGTPAYMAPETANGGPALRASDWYAVGVMLFEALTGRLPFEGNSLQMLHEKRERDAPDPRSYVAGLPDALSEVCNSLLLRDPGQRADGVQLLSVLGQEAQRPRGEIEPVRAASPALFVGRESELNALHAALQAVMFGTPRSVLVTGTSGMGKTALLDRFASLIGDRALVLRGRCHAQESVPYKVFDSVVDALTRYLRRLPNDEVAPLLPRHLSALLQLFPVLGQVPAVASALATHARPTLAREVRNQAFAALKELLLRLCDRKTLVIVVDDLHWGDIDSARMLAHVLSPPEAPLLMFVGACRSDELQTSDFLRTVLTGELVPQGGWQPELLKLGRLDRAEAARLADELIGVLPAVRASIGDVIAAEADGVPLFVSELARHFGGAGRGDDAWLRTDQRISFEQLILDRVAALPEDVQRLLRVLSVAGAPIAQGVAAEAAGLPRGERAPLLSLRLARLVRLRAGGRDDLAEIYHDRLRETIVADMSAESIRAAHEQLASALERDDQASPERLVLHYTGAGDRVRAGKTALQAAHSAMQKLAFNNAAALFQKAIELLPLSGQRPHELYRCLGDALANAGRNIEAAAAYLKGAESSSTELAPLLRRLAARQYLSSSKVLKGFALSRELFAEVGIKLPVSEAAALRAYAWERICLRVRGIKIPERGQQPRKGPRAEQLEVVADLVGGITWSDALVGAVLQSKYLRSALDVGDLEHIQLSLGSEVLNRSMIGGPRNEQRAAQLEAYIRLAADRIDTPYARAVADVAESNRLFWAGRQLKTASSSAARALEVFSREASPAVFWERTMATFLRVVSLTYTGDLRDLAQISADTEREAYERNDVFSVSVMLSTRPLYDLIRDNPDAALELLEKMRSWMRKSLNSRFTWWVQKSETLLYAGRVREAWALIEAEWPAFRGSYLHRCKHIRHTANLTRARCAIAMYREKPGEATRASAWRATRALPDSDDVHGGYRAALTGALYDLQGDRVKAMQNLRLSVQRLQECEAELNVLYPERRLRELAGESAAVLRIDQTLRDQGVLNPALWAWTCLPTRTD